MSRGSKIIHIPEKQKIIKEPRGRNEMGPWQERLVPYQYVTYWHTIHYNCETKTDKCQEGRKLFTYPKTKEPKTKVPKHGIDSSLECAIEVFEQPRRTRGFEENSVQNLPGME